MSCYTFLGCGKNALSMFIEILFANHQGHPFFIEVIKNTQVNDDIPFLPPGIQFNEFYFDQFDYSVEKQYVIGVNKPNAKKQVFEFFKQYAGINFEKYQTLVHPMSTLASTIQLGKGVVVNPGTTIAPFARLGHLVTLNRHVSVGHHTIIDDFTTLHPGVNVAGHCKIGKGVTIGMGANVIDGISIGDNAIIGAGALVAKNIEANTLVMGVPAKVVERK